MKQNWTNQKKNPYTHLLLGDLNSHNTIWGCQKNNKKDKDLEKVINNNKLCILNNKSQTYLNPFTGSYSAIDLPLCDRLPCVCVCVCVEMLNWSKYSLSKCHSNYCADLLTSNDWTNLPPWTFPTLIFLSKQVKICILVLQDFTRPLSTYFHVGCSHVLSWNILCMQSMCIAVSALKAS